ncbi:MAG: multiple sugar transport system substrate-binding protein [Thermotogaceae bacterium]|jgi:multiple sugar transport system substrate-binding protein|nr:multiple sugar transport system substrate-binding protein [Thermosipho sp. (in: thermotogales)]MDN5337703.1 multiple sugar transport system substrate-binding protein [Thermotogaceae bacterium]
MKGKKIFVFLMILVLMISGLAFSKTVITIQTYWSEEDENNTPFFEMLKKYQELHPDVEIKHYYVPFAELIKTLLTQSLTGSLPDIVFADNPDIRYLAAAGVFKDLTPLVEEWGVWDDFFPGSRAAVTYEGKIYALHQSTNNLALWYNKEFFEKAGIKEPPKTWDEVLEYCKILKDKFGKDGVYPIGFSAVNSEEGTWQFEPFLWSAGGNLLELDSKESIQALEFVTELVKEGYAPKDVMNWGQGDLTEYFRNRKLVMIVQGCWELGDVTGFQEVNMYLGQNIDIAKIPVPKEGMKPVVPMGGECFGLSATIEPSKEKIAWDIIKFLNSSENMAKFCAGAGRVPTRASAVPLLLELVPELEVFAKQAETAICRPVAGGGEKYTEVSSITINAVQQALSGALSPSEAFKQAAKKIRKLFKNDKEYQKALEEAINALKAVQ